MAMDFEIDPSAQRRVPEPAPGWAGPLSGLIAAGAAVCIGLVVAAMMDVVSPLDAVGSEFIDHTPPWLKRWAIDVFGTQDKLALRGGMVITMGLIALLVGRLARRRPLIGPIGIVLFGLLGAIVAAGRPAETASAIVPALLGAAGGAWLIWYLIEMVRSNDGATELPMASRAPLGWDRRRFMVTAGTATAVAAVAAGSARKIENVRIEDIRESAPEVLPPVDSTDAVAVETPAGAQLSDATPFITPADDFYRIDTALSFPRIRLDKWTVDITGMVDNPISLNYDALLARPQVDRMVTLACVSNEVGGNLIGNAVWQGVLLADLLKEAGVHDGADQVFSTSADGWTCGFPTSVAFDGRDAMIALGMNGKPLPLEHGFPARLVVPGLYGYVSATKWLSTIELTTFESAEGYWVPRGWSALGPIKTQSRIDVPRSRESVPAGRTPIAGIAWAQHRGVAKVEVRVDEGEWQEARLGTDVTDDSWRQWVYDWDATSGDHVIQVRATDKNGDTQIEETSRPDPDGATGYHTRTVSVD